MDKREFDEGRKRGRQDRALKDYFDLHNLDDREAKQSRRYGYWLGKKDRARAEARKQKAEAERSTHKRHYGGSKTAKKDTIVVWSILAPVGGCVVYGGIDNGSEGALVGLICGAVLCVVTVPIGNLIGAIIYGLDD